MFTIMFFKELFDVISLQHTWARWSAVCRAGEQAGQKFGSHCINLFDLWVAAQISFVLDTHLLLQF